MNNTTTPNISQIKEIVDARYAKLRNYAAIDYVQFSNWQEPEQLGLLTIIVGLIPIYVDMNEDDVSNEIIRHCNNFKKEFRKFIRKECPGIKWRGAFELDLVRNIDNKPRMKMLFDDLGELPTSDKPVINLHFHALIDCQGYSRSVMAELFRMQWNCNWQVDLRKLSDTKSVEDNARDIGVYCFKCNMQYSKQSDEHVAFVGEYAPKFMKMLYRILFKIDETVIKFNSGK